MNSKEIKLHVLTPHVAMCTEKIQPTTDVQVETEGVTPRGFHQRYFTIN